MEWDIGRLILTANSTVFKVILSFSQVRAPLSRSATNVVLAPRSSRPASLDLLFPLGFLLAMLLLL